MIVTHWDKDHAGGAEAVLLGISVPLLILPRMDYRQEKPTITEKETLEAARRAGARIVVVARGQNIQTGDGVQIEVLNPPARPHRFKNHADNNGSVVLRISYGKRRFLLTGDAEEEAELLMLRSGVDVRADVLKVGHHGSGSSTSVRWLNAVRPSRAVISVGARNAFGHPKPEVVDRIMRRRIRIYRTDRDGTILMRTDGTYLQTRTNVR
jgi:beta-lactamase superfamily II metal-dependent hydrolase